MARGIFIYRIKALNWYNVRVTKKTVWGIMKKRFIVLAAVIAAHSLVFSLGTGPGTTATNFLKIEPFARPAGMGEAFISASDGSYGMFYNPACLDAVLGYEAQFSHIAWFSGINYDYLAVVNPDPLLDWGKIGLAICYISPGDMAATNDITSYDPAYLNMLPDLSQFITGKFTPKSYAIIFGYSLDPTEDLSLGLNLKLTTDYLDEAKDSNVSFDIGAIYKVLLEGHYIRLGALVADIGTPSNIGGEDFSQPLSATFGISDLTTIADCDFLISCQSSVQMDSDMTIGAGAEYWFYDMYALRAGLVLQHTLRPTFGAGVRWKNMEVDYGFENYETLGAVHRISLLYSWGTPPARLKVDPYYISTGRDSQRNKMTFTPILQQKEMIESVVINIYDKTGNKLLASIPAKDPDSRVEWDGRINGAPAPDGTYMAAVAAEYTVNGTSESKKVAVIVDSTPPVVSLLASPDVKVAGRAALLIPVNFEMRATDNTMVDKWQLVVWDSAKKPYFTLAGAGEPPEKFTWDGKGNDGTYARTNETYYFGLFAWDSLGNRGATQALQRLLLVKEIKIIFSSDALFDPGMSDVKVSAYHMVSEMKNVLSQYPGTSITVAGHTDNLPPSSRGVYRDNAELSKARAEAVKYFMVNILGIDVDKITTEGDADNFPVASNDTPADRGKNRRVEIIIRPDVYK